MVNFTIEQVRKLMGDPNSIRNMSVIAHVDHGKTTLTDSFLAKAGMISKKQAGQARGLDGRQDEQERGITIKSTGVTLYYELEKPYLINLIDSPGHVDFSAEVTAALRVTDGALVVVDSVEGVCVQTETVLRQACQEKIRAVLMINKMDRVILEMQLDGEQIYQRISATIAKVNQILETYDAKPLEVSLSQVAFGAGKDCWGFTVNTFAQKIAKKINKDPIQLAKSLWGENYFNFETKKIQKENETQDGKQLKRTFVHFILDPVIAIVKAIMNADQEYIKKFLIQENIQITEQESKLVGKELLKVIMSSWLNAADNILEMVVNHLPSPKEAQVYRTPYLYEGPLDDDIAKAMIACDPQGPLIMYVSKFVPSVEKGHFYAFGRVFSGTISTGQKVRILGQNYENGKQDDLFEKNITRTLVMMGSKPEFVQDVPCGNTVALAGIDQLSLKTATITNDPRAFKIRTMKFSVSPVVRVSVAVKNAQDLPYLVEGIKKLIGTDNIVTCTKEESGELVLGCCGDLHAEIVIKDLREFAKVPLIVKDPVVQYRETITKQSKQCLTKSANNLNRLFGIGEPLRDDLQDEIDKGKIINEDPKKRANILSEEYDWDKQQALRIWCFGPENQGPNILTDTTVGIQGLGQIQQQMTEAFQWVTRQGVLAEEPMRGMKINLTDCKIHPDHVHSGGGQILQAARRLYYACELSAEPRLQEPIFLSEIVLPQHMSGQVYQCLNKRKGIVIEETQLQDSPMNLIKAYLPVSKSFGFAGQLREMTQGMAFPQNSFDHWEIVQGNPLEQGTDAYDIVLGIRSRKGLKVEIPKFDEYNDKL